jgi:3-(3-hydroxy-phenyl)propionate hydroxylase/flavoprotein hydroxylase
MDATYDVIIVGYGPVGMVAACLLGRAGHRVAVFERYPAIYRLPRVGGVHDDVFRILQQIGVAEKIMAESTIPSHSDFAHGDTVLFESPFAPHTIHGWPQLISLYQPFVEGALDERAKGIPSLEIRQGFPVVGVSQTADYAEVTVEETATGKRSTARARYLIAADGGSSFVRGALSLKSENLGFDQDWVVIDAIVKKERPGWPIMRLYGNPERPGMTTRMGQGYRRWAYMMKEDERPDEIVQPESVWRILDWEGGATRDEVELIRQACYTFKSLILSEWKIGRIFMAGDAAHVMPPFLGQGLCSGVRDAYNLSWKLDLVLRGAAPERLLDTYTIEREPNVRTAIVESVRLGRAVIEQDPVKVAERDTWLRGLSRGGYGLVGYRPAGIGEGFLATSGNPKGIGEIFAQGNVALAGRSCRFDDAVGSHFVAISRAGDPRAALPPPQKEFWDRIGGKSFQVGPAGSVAGLIDLDGECDRMLQDWDCDVIVRRPDHYVFGTCKSIADFPRLVDNMRDQLGGRTPWAASPAPREKARAAS